jgi:transcriptional regulator with XRE-family HTH domain
VKLSAEEVAIAKRIHLIRKENHVSQSLASTQMGLSRDQLKRIERGEVAIRFFPAWNFCQFTNLNPLWLAFGDPEKRFGFVACANSTVQDEALFLEVMQTYGERYRTYRFLTHSSWFESGSVFSEKTDSVLGADFITLDRNFELAQKTRQGLSIKYPLISAKNATGSLTWDELRKIMCSKTASPVAKAGLAGRLGVSLAAVSQWRSGATAPTADKTLQILAWVRESETKQQKKRPAGRAQPTPRTRKGKLKRKS